MSPWSVAGRVVAVLALLVLQFAVAPLVGGPVRPDFVAIGVLLVATTVRPGAAACVGLACGFVVDCLAPGGFGASSLAWTLVAYGAAWLRGISFGDQLPFTAAYVAAGKWVADAIMLLIAGDISSAGPGTALQLLLWAPLSAVVTALVAVFLLVLVRPFAPTGLRVAPSGRLLR